jgi:hypothetical protein
MRGAPIALPAKLDPHRAQLVLPRGAMIPQDPQSGIRIAGCMTKKADHLRSAGERRYRDFW